MKKALIAALFFVSSGVHASDSFTGLSIELGGINRGLEGQITNLKVDGAPIPDFSVDRIDKTKALGEIALRFNWDISPRFVLGLSYERALQDAKLGALMGTSEGERGAVVDRVTMSNLQSIVFQPSIKLTDSTLAGLRLGYSTMQIKFESTGEPTTKINTSGFLVGIGMMQMLTHHFYIGGSLDLLKGKDKNVSYFSEGETTSYALETKGAAARLFVGLRF